MKNMIFGIYALEGARGIECYHSTRNPVLLPTYLCKPAFASTGKSIEWKIRTQFLLNPTRMSPLENKQTHAFTCLAEIDISSTGFLFLFPSNPCLPLRIVFSFARVQSSLPLPPFIRITANAYRAQIIQDNRPISRFLTQSHLQGHLFQRVSHL